MLCAIRVDVTRKICFFFLEFEMIMLQGVVKIVKMFVWYYVYMSVSIGDTLCV